MKTKLLHGYEVETCIELPSDGAGGCDVDAAKYRRFEFKTLEAANKKANELLPKDCFGAVQIIEFVREPLVDEYPSVLHKVYIADAIEVS